MFVSTVYRRAWIATSVRTALLSESVHFKGFSAHAAPDTATSSGMFGRSLFKSADTAKSAAISWE